MDNLFLHQDWLLSILTPLRQMSLANQALHRPKSISGIPQLDSPQMILGQSTYKVPSF